MYHKAIFPLTIVMSLIGLGCVTVTFFASSVYATTFASVGVFSDVREYDQNDFPGQSRIARMMVYADATGDVVTVDSTPTGDGVQLVWDSGNNLWVEVFYSPSIGVAWQTTYTFHSGSSIFNLDISGCSINELPVPNVTISADGRTISWDPVDNATYYSLYWYPLKDGLPDESGGPSVKINRIDDTSLTLSDPTPGTYALRLNAHERCSGANVNRSTLYKKHTIISRPSGIPTINVPGIEKGELSTSNSIDLYKLACGGYSRNVTVSLISTDFDTHLSLFVSEKFGWMYNDNATEIFGTNSTNSQISLELAGPHTLMVASKDGNGEYTLVTRNIGETGIQSICGWRNDYYPVVIKDKGPGGKDNPNAWIVEMTYVGGPEDVGRCGKGDLEGTLDCFNSNRYTLDCLNHDVCADKYGRFDIKCLGLANKAKDDCFSFAAPECAGPQYVDPCAGQSPCYTKIQSAMDAGGDGSTIRIPPGIYSEHLVGLLPKIITLWGGWVSRSQTDSSKSTVNSLTITDGTIIINNLALENRLTITDDGTIIVDKLEIK